VVGLRFKVLDPGNWDSEVGIGEALQWQVCSSRMYFHFWNLKFALVTAPSRLGRVMVLVYKTELGNRNRSNNF